mmetsp:Transcript_34916/g.53603  ORF Transcript_34916/g.53603 Transcript_34916/m.53603 type:complete len:129 (+) Transcript_34916:272-658(+)|eukprot:CAMPEP_0170478824 /NCGR_PEP_ID=MMETSP0208-20121228/271_1 /TAXON_ID=197538 /ORGANISM="Strombidium inclinatum, Strain S3" /LENGTH=128 /DNA_ID=CAMNT_0010751141 /DNA_START=268 /DNA_END=654 /DNA_ORIENTATION=+
MAYWIFVKNQTEFYPKDDEVWIQLFAQKSDQTSGSWSTMLRNLSRQTEDFPKDKYTFTWSDMNHEEALATAFNTIYTPHMFIMDFKTKKAYSWDFSLNATTDLKDWILKKEYLNSPIQFDIPRPANQG